VFDVSISKLVNNGCDTLFGECGYISLTSKHEKFKTYYQVYTGDDFYTAVAKGFIYFIDTFPIPAHEIDKEDYLDSLFREPYNLDALEFELSRFDYHIYSQNSTEIIIGSGDGNKKIDITMGFDFVEPLNGEFPNNTHFIRCFNYYKPAPEQDNSSFFVF
jgi:hypothetical protein